LFNATEMVGAKELSNTLINKQLRPLIEWDERRTVGLPKTPNINAGILSSVTTWLRSWWK